MRRFFHLILAASFTVFGSGCEELLEIIQQIGSLEGTVNAILTEGETVLALRVISNDRDEEQDEYYAYHPIRVGMVFEGAAEYTEDQLLIGLVQEHSTELTEAELGTADIATCRLGGFKAVREGVHVGTDINVIYLEQEFLIPSDCLKNSDGSMADFRDFNIWIGVNPKMVSNETEAGEVNEEDFNTAFFNQWNLENEKGDVDVCLLLDGSAPLDEDVGLVQLVNFVVKDSNGCVKTIRVSQSPGADIALDLMESQSSVAVVPVDLASTLPPGATAPTEDGVTETVPDNADVFLSVDLTIDLQGLDPGTGPTAGEVNQLAELVDGDQVIADFAICPAELDLDGNGDPKLDPDTGQAIVLGCAETAVPLLVGNAGAEGPDLDYGAPVTFLNVGAPSVFSFDLFLDDETLFALQTTGDAPQANTTPAWADYSLFIIDSCLDVPFDEKSNIDTEANNCKSIEVAVAPVAPDNNAANVKTFYYNKQDWSGNSIVGGGYRFYTDQRLDLDGAKSRQGGYGDLTGWLSLRIFEAWANGNAYVSLVGSGYDAGLKVLGYSLWGASQTIQDYYNNWNLAEYSKQACINYNYGIGGIGLNVSFCAVGTASLDLELTVEAENGCDAAANFFGSCQRVGVARLILTPSAGFNLAASAYGDLGFIKGGISGTLQIIGVEIPLTGALRWGVMSWSPFQLGIRGDVYFDFKLSTLSGGAWVWVDLWRPAWCSCGSWCPGYPCGGWSRIVNWHLIHFNGYSWNYRIFSAVAQTTLQ